MSSHAGSPPHTLLWADKNPLTVCTVLYFLIYFSAETVVAREPEMLLSAATQVGPLTITVMLHFNVAAVSRDGKERKELL